MEIRLYRERPSIQRPGKLIVGQLWDYLAQLHGNVGVAPKSKRKPRQNL